MPQRVAATRWSLFAAWQDPARTGPDFATFRPDLELVPQGWQVFVKWGWQRQGAFLDMIELQVDRGSGFTLLAQDTTPGYLDTTPPPPRNGATKPSSASATNASGSGVMW